MDATKTGKLICRLRKERQMTQIQLAHGKLLWYCSNHGLFYQYI